jgi:NAD(P)-dependent dehydrogenase (short-subunit alcohol dehydrogenase family)
VWITGTSTGIGAACALDLAGRGFRVFAGVRKESDGQRLQSQAAGELVPVTVDVTDAEAVRAAAAMLAAAVGEAGLAGVVCNAGISVPGPLELLSGSEFRRQLEVNVLGTHAVAVAALPLLRAARGRIVIIGSITGFVVPPYYGAYAASKHALEAVADALRMELRPWQIGVSIVEPDYTATPIWGKLDSALTRLGGDGSPQVKEFYESRVQQLRRATARMGQVAGSTSKVVGAVRHALCAPHPKARYPVGLRTRLARWGAYHLPTSVLDWFLGKAVGLS